MKALVYNGLRDVSVVAYNHRLCKLIEEGKVSPSFIVSHDCRWSRLRMATNTSTRERKAGRRSF